jgi:hypothetical protein
VDTDSASELTPEERRALAALAAGPAPPADLERRTVERLRRAGALRGADRRRRGAWLAAAAAAVAAVSGMAVGLWLGQRAPAAPAGAERYVLLLWEDARAAAQSDPSAVAEYGRWAQAVRESGVAISGEKLAAERRVLEPAGGAARGAPGDTVLAGYFLVEVGSLAEAEAIALGCPHLRHGRVEVRRIEPT